jgi:hypothetical protein
MSSVLEKGRSLEAASTSTLDAARAELPELDAELWFESFVALPGWLGPDLGPQLEAWIFSPPREPAQANSPSREPRGAALEPTRAPRDGQHTDLEGTGFEATALEEGPEQTDPDAVHSEQHGSSAPQTDAGRTHVTERAAVQSPFSFWSEVVSVQRELEQRARLEPKQALGTALVWVALAHVQGAQRAQAPASSAASARSEQRALDAKAFVERLHTDLEARATSALVTAWQLRASALSAAEGNRG